MIDGIRQFTDYPSCVLRDLNQVFAGLQQFLGKGSRKHRIGIVVILRQAIQRSLPRTRGENRKHPLGQCGHRRQTATAGNRAGPRSFERVVATGIQHEDSRAGLAILQPLDDAVGEDGGITHQIFLAFDRGGHIGRQQKVLPGDFEAVAGVEEECGIALFD